MQLRLVVPMLASLTLLTACNPYDTTQRTVGGGLLGAGSGAAIGALAGGGRGAAIGSLAGGVVGAATGYLTTPQNQNRYGQNNQGYYPNQEKAPQCQG